MRMLIGPPSLTHATISITYQEIADFFAQRKRLEFAVNGAIKRAFLRQEFEAEKPGLVILVEYEDVLSTPPGNYQYRLVNLRHNEVPGDRIPVGKVYLSRVDFYLHLERITTEPEQASDHRELSLGPVS